MAPVSAVAIVCAFPQTANAAQVQAFDVPAGALSDALIMLAEQAEISIVVDDPAIRRVHSDGLRGRYDTSAALRRLLRGSGFDFAFIDVKTVRLVRKPAARRIKPQPLLRPAAPAVTASTGPDIVVTATKQRLGLQDYPASMSVIAPDRQELARSGGQGSAYLLGRLPELSSTNLGPGRNKIFIRGIADSSFNGTSQSTISQYFGESRLIYSAPDPDISLYDIARVEVLEGPQGTLYGAGTLGGIIRLVPNAPDAQQASFAASAGTRFTDHGASGGDGAVTVNIPLIAQALALRAVAYANVDGGYIDDTQRALHNINRNKTTGARLAIRWHPSSTWTADASFLAQNLASRDGQYTLIGEAALTRRSAMAQPFDNDYRLASAVFTHDAGGALLVSATGYAHHAIDSVFDATTASDPSAARKYEEDVLVNLLTHETRLSGGWGEAGTFLAGISIVKNNDRATRRLGDPDAPTVLSAVSNSTFDAALFGEVGVPLMQGIVVTLGGRLNYIDQTSELLSEGSGSFEPRSHTLRFMPSLALSWKPRDAVLVYGRYQEGYRPGALQVVATNGAVNAETFRPDRIRTVELGVRFGLDEDARLSGGVAASLAQWRSIQADLISLDGLPYVANIGTGTVRNIAVSLAWRPTQSFNVEASGFLNSSHLSDPAAAFADTPDRDLPNVADQGWRVAARYDRQLSIADVTLDAAVRYVGRSKLAIGTPFALTQGRYYDVSAGMRWGFGAWGISFDIDNVLNEIGNTFSYGNPFTAKDGLQQTPMRPRSIRLGVDAAF